LVFWPRSKKKVTKTAVEKELLFRCLGDKERMERLIKLELKRDPALSREEAVKDAVESHKRDNRWKEKK
jgi:hypothetical protein